MNVYKKYCPNVYVAECDEEHKNGMQLQYAKNAVNEMQKKYDTAVKLWG